MMFRSRHGIATISATVAELYADVVVARPGRGRAQRRITDKSHAYVGPRGSQRLKSFATSRSIRDMTCLHNIADGLPSPAYPVESWTS